jgi:hypothetical protein
LGSAAWALADARAAPSVASSASVAGNFLASEKECIQSLLLLVGKL